VKGGPSPNQYNSFADFLLGLPTTATNNVQAASVIAMRTWILNPYVTDQWQISPKVTLAIGTGWEYYPVPTRADRRIEYFDLNAKQYLLCGKGPNPIDCGIHVQKVLFSPRVGVAFRTANNYVIRAGFSLNPEQINMYRDELNNYPAVVTGSYSGANSYTAYRHRAGYSNRQCSRHFVWRSCSSRRYHLCLRTEEFCSWLYGILQSYGGTQLWPSMAGSGWICRLAQCAPAYEVQHQLRAAGWRRCKSAVQQWNPGHGHHRVNDNHLSLRSNELQLAAKHVTASFRTRFPVERCVHLVKVDGNLLRCQWRRRPRHPDPPVWCS
jgi:hypothetical protein